MRGEAIYKMSQSKHDFVVSKGQLNFIAVQYFEKDINNNNNDAQLKSIWNETMNKARRKNVANNVCNKHN